MQSLIPLQALENITLIAICAFAVIKIVTERLLSFSSIWGTKSTKEEHFKPTNDD